MCYIVESPAVPGAMDLYCAGIAPEVLAGGTVSMTSLYAADTISTTKLYINGTEITGSGGGSGGVVRNPNDCIESESPIWDDTNNEFYCAGGDITPASFDFLNDVYESAGQTIESFNIIEITEINVPASVSIAGQGSPQFQVCSDASCNTTLHTWASSGNIEDGEYLQIRMTAPTPAGATISSTVSVGSVSDDWQIQQGDITPNSFEFFNDQYDVGGEVVLSNIVQITGIDVPTNVSTSGQGAPAFRICADSACNTVNHGFTSAEKIVANEYLQLSMTAPNPPGATISSTVTVGTVDGSWEIEWD
mgnify:FL=1